MLRSLPADLHVLGEIHRAHETEADLGEVGAERIRELKTKRDEVLRTLAKLKPLHSVPPYLYKPETIQRF